MTGPVRCQDAALIYWLQRSYCQTWKSLPLQAAGFASLNRDNDIFYREFLLQVAHNRREIAGKSLPRCRIVIGELEIVAVLGTDPGTV